jgi:hypothetical protein
MPCDTRRLPNQTLTERKAEVKTAIERLIAKLTSGTVRPVVGLTGAIAFQGWGDNERSRVTDACAYRTIMATGSASAKAAIARAEMLSGRTVNRASVAAGHHSHDGGVTWHGGHKS